MFFGFIRDLRPCQPFISRFVAVESQVPACAGYPGCWRRLWGRVVFPWGFVPEPRLRLFPAGESEVPTLGSGQPGLRPPSRGSDSSPRPPPLPGGGCCYSQPESLGEGEEAAAALGHLPSALGREEAGGSGLRSSGLPHTGRRACSGPGVTGIFYR